MRRLPVYLLLDTSGSMAGEPIEAVRTGVDMLVSTLCQDPYALETVWLSIITFDRDTKVLLPLTPLIGALRHVMQEGAGVLQIIPELSIITIWGVLTFLIAIRIFRWE